MKKKYLLTPGPTPLPPEVKTALGKPIIHHRTAEYQDLFKEVNQGLKNLFQTQEEVLTLASSGTGAMESAVVNLLSSPDKAIVLQGGKFGQRWAEICQAYGVEVIPVELEWGKSADLAMIKELLEKNPETKAVFTTLCETSTGVKTDVEGIARITKGTDAVVVVDAISGLGAMELRMDAWGLDVVVSGSQKGMMLPPGLAFIALSKKAWQLTEQSQLPSYYLNLVKAKKVLLSKGDTPYTPAVSLVVALKEALALIQEEGIEEVWKRHSYLAEATRKAVEALGLELFADSPANAVTAVKLPPSVDGQKLYQIMKDELGVQVAGGQEQLKGKIIRIAHLGYMGSFDIITGLSALEMALKKMGYPVKMGEGLKAAQEILGELY